MWHQEKTSRCGTPCREEFASSTVSQSQRHKSQLKREPPITIERPRQLVPSQKQRRNGQPLMPAHDYKSLKKNVTTYGMYLLAFFGVDCPHYQGVWCIRRQLEYLSESATHFTAKYCREITWAIIVDCCHFFHQRLVEDNFAEQNID